LYTKEKLLDVLLPYIGQLILGDLTKKKQKILVEAFYNYDQTLENSLENENDPIFSLKLVLQCLTKCNSFTEGIEYIKARCQNKLSCAMHGAIYGQIAGIIYANDRSRGVPVAWLNKLPFPSMIGVLSLTLAQKKFSDFFEVHNGSSYNSVIDFYHKVMKNKKPTDNFIQQITDDNTIFEDLFSSQSNILDEVVIEEKKEIEFTGFEKFLVVDINETVKSWDTGV